MALETGMSQNVLNATPYRLSRSSGAAFLAALVLAAVVLALAGAGEHGTVAALKVTGRLSFLLFLPAYVGGAAAVLLGPSFNVMKRQARRFGLAFASAHIVHLLLVGWLCYIGDVPAVATFIVFGIAVFWTYLLALLSIGRLRQMVGHTGWGLVSVIGLNYIDAVFAIDFVGAPFHADLKYLIGYFPFAVLAILGPLIRVGAIMRLHMVKSHA